VYPLRQPAGGGVRPEVLQDCVVGTALQQRIDEAVDEAIIQFQDVRLRHAGQGYRKPGLVMDQEAALSALEGEPRQQRQL
jgi:hypothetical protein